LGKAFSANKLLDLCALRLRRFQPMSLHNPLKVADDWIEGGVLIVRRTPELDPGAGFAADLLFKSLNQMRFADTRFALNGDDLPMAILCLLPVDLQQTKFFIAPDEGTQSGR